MCELRGGVRIGHVHGPPNHLFSTLGYVKLSFDGDNPARAQRLHWASTHFKELPITFAVCADHVDIARMLLARDRASPGAALLDLIGVAW